MRLAHIRLMRVVAAIRPWSRKAWAEGGDRHMSGVATARRARAIARPATMTEADRAIFFFFLNT
ncbi:hypothetical protein [Streptomyces sp. NPDC052721]|uniref:hypothetical protein n=1 Tax=Streptomyces sp. NPDC052721 TaxID=3154955 RepID=UPI0034435BBA